MFCILVKIHDELRITFSENILTKEINTVI
jgi:hypothetical protein